MAPRASSSTPTPFTQAERPRRPGGELGEQTGKGEGIIPGATLTAASGISLSLLPTLLTCLPCPSLQPLTSRAKTRRAPLRGSFGYPGGGNPQQIERRWLPAAEVLTFCSSSRRRRRRLESHYLLLLFLLSSSSSSSFSPA